MRARRIPSALAALTGSLLVAGLVVACGPGLPASVTEGSEVSVGWSEDLTSLNAATTTGATTGNQEVAAATHDAFARLVDGDVVTDESFGTVEVTDAADDSFMVRYDLADRSWSDGVPLDAADLLLAWAANSNATAGEFDSIASGLRQSTALPTMDDFARRIDVPFDAPVSDWHTALDVAVPAHVVGQLALDVEDPMEAKQAVIDAIASGDTDDLEAIAEVWNTGFDLDATGALPEALTVANGPYQVTGVEPAELGGDRVTLEVNRAYTGDTPPTYERIDVGAPDSVLGSFPDDLDVVQVSPTPENFETVRDLQRRDHHLSSTDDGLLWTLVLRSDDGVFSDRAARRAFLSAPPRSDLTSAGAGVWTDAYSNTESLLFAPESDGYEFAVEDAGLRETFDASTADPGAERTAAGVAADTEVCVLYDTDEAFASGAFQALQQGVAEAGWAVTDCGESDIGPALEDGAEWQAVLTTVPLAQTPEDIAAVWGGTEASPLTGSPDNRRARILEELAQTANPYDARALRVAVEAGLVREAVALPLALDPVLTLSARPMRTVLPESGSKTTLLAGAASWQPES